VTLLLVHSLNGSVLSWDLHTYAYVDVSQCVDSCSLGFIKYGV